MTNEEKIYIKLLGITSKRYDMPFRTFYHSKMSEDKMTFIVLIEDKANNGTTRIIYEAESLV